MEKTHYEILGLTRSFLPEELKCAWRKLAKQHHPDAGGNAAEFAQVSEAYATLKDRSRRASYDARLDLLSRPCAECSGKGKIYRQKGFTSRVEKPCPACNGTGRQQNAIKLRG